MRTSLHLKKIVILFVWVLLGSCALVAQTTNTANASYVRDTNVVVKKEHGLLGFIARIFHKPQNKRSADTATTSKKKTNKSDSTASVKKPHKQVLDFTKGGLTYTSLYTQGVNLNTGVSGLYNLAHVYQGFDVLGLPLKAQATGVIDNGQFEKGYSSYSVDFDAQTFLTRLRQRALNDITNKEASARNLQNKNHVNMADSMQAFESVRGQLNSPSYQNDITQAKTLLKKDQDSLGKNPSMDTTELHGLRQKVMGFEQLEKRYEQLFALKKNYSSLASKDTAITNNENRLEKDKQLLNDPSNLEKQLENNKMLSSYEKFLMGVEKFSIGQSNQEISDFTLHNFMMKGVLIGYKEDNWHISGGYGKEISIIDPYLFTGVNIPSYNRTIEYARVGTGTMQSSNFYATVLRISDPGSATSLGETNWVIDLSKKIVLNKNMFIEGEAAQSFFKYIPNKSDSTPIPFTAKNDLSLAYSIKGQGTVPFTKTIVKAEYLYTGADFITLGNAYLLGGEHMYRAEIDQPIGSKLGIGIGGAHTLQDLLNSDGSTQTDNWIDFSLKYKPSKALNMELKYSPRELQQQEGAVVANNIATNMNQMSFMCNSFCRVLGKDACTTVFIGNFQYSTPESTLFLSQNTNLTYYMFNEVFSLSSNKGITISADESRNDWTGSLAQMISECTLDVNFGKNLSTTGGLQWIEQPGVLSDGVGIIGSIGKSFSKWGRLSLQLNCRNSINTPFDLNTAQLIISSNVSILW